MNLLYAHVLLDRSGSMESCRDATIEAFNGYVKGIAADPNVDAAISLTIFDSQSVDLVHDGIKANLMPALTKETFVPRASTPLNDAIGKTVSRMEKEWHRPGEKIALVILTDGQENCSKSFTTSDVKALLERVQGQGWLVIYLGANQDAFAEGGKRGTVVANTMGFDTKNVGVTMEATRRATHAFYSGAGEKAMSFTDDERRLAAGK